LGAERATGGGWENLTTAALFFPSAPIKMSETVYESLEKMGKKQNKEQVPPPAEPQNKKPSTSKPAKKSHSSNTVAPAATHKSLEEAFKALDVGDLKQQLARSQTLFPDNPSVWVKDLAGYLNLNLTAPETEPTLSSYTHDYPYCLTGKELKGVIKGLIGRCSDILPDFFDHCVYTMLRELDRQTGEPLHGYRVCIQAILQDKPRIATQNLPEYFELLRSVKNRPVKCLTIMWVLGQAGFYDLSQGLRVWLDIMLPVLEVKSLSAYAIAYLDRLLLLHANLTKGFGIMGPKDFFPLLDFAFMPKNALSSSLQEQLRRLYPRLKVLAFGAKPESTLHTYLPSFLSRATSHCPNEMKRELLSSMTECLCVDVQSLGVWRQLYTKHLPQSRLLMVLFVFAAGFIAQDVRSHGSFADSTTARYLRDSGVTGVSQQAWSKITVNTNTPDSVFEVLAYLKELLLLLHQNYVLPALAHISDLLLRAWTNLQDSCKSVLPGFYLKFEFVECSWHITADLKL
uniref:Transmembrane protein 214 n=1 Tax=Scophthalmus maximus TaxID=52904 RepID=A0A8D3E5V2_SCOMX